MKELQGLLLWLKKLSANTELFFERKKNIMAQEEEHGLS